MNPAWVAALAALAGIVLGVLGWLLRTSWRTFRKADQFLTDWNGVTGDNAHEPRPGVMRRLSTLEQSMVSFQAAMDDIRGQVHLNSGHSLRDEVQRTEAAVDTLTGKMDDVQRTVDELKARA